MQYVSEDLRDNDTIDHKIEMESKLRSTNLCSMTCIMPTYWVGPSRILRHRGHARSEDLHAYDMTYQSIGGRSSYGQKNIWLRRLAYCQNILGQLAQITWVTRGGIAEDSYEGGVASQKTWRARYLTPTYKPFVVSWPTPKCLVSTR